MTSVLFFVTLKKIHAMKDMEIKKKKAKGQEAKESAEGGEGAQ